MKKSRKAVGYARVSTEGQAENTSTADQIEKIQDYCRLYEYDLTRVFVDNGSGSSVERAAYRELVQYLSDPENEVTAVVVLRADRIHRRLRELLFFFEDVIQPLGIAFISITESFDTSTFQGVLFLQMIGSFGEFERKVINERTKNGRVKTARNGEYAGGEPPYGYRIRNRQLVVDEDRAAVIRNIFEWASQGRTPAEIARTLNNGGVPTKRGKAPWNRAAVAYILHNACYCGTYTYHGRSEKNGINNKIPAIVSRRLWNKAQNGKKSFWAV